MDKTVGKDFEEGLKDLKVNSRKLEVMVGWFEIPVNNLASSKNVL